MTLLICIFLIVYMAVTSADAGGSMPWSRKWKWAFIPELLFVLPIAVVSTWQTQMLVGLPPLGSVLWFIVSYFISYIFMQSATSPGLNWDWDYHGPRGKKPSSKTLTKALDVIVNVLNFPLKLFKKEIVLPEQGSEAYAWLYMSFKGFLMTLPIGGLGAIAWPLGYEIGSHGKDRIRHHHRYTEMIAGAICAIAVISYCGIMGLLKSYYM